MKIFSVKTCLAALLLSTPLVHCSEALSGTNTYHGTTITLGSIRELLPQLDAATEQAIQAWMVEHQELIEALTNLDVCGDIESRKARFAKLNEFIAAHNLTNVSKYNFVLPFSASVNGIEKRFFVKIPGMPIVRSNYNAELEVLKETARLAAEGAIVPAPADRPCINLADPFADLSYEDRDKVCYAGKCSTVQSISRAAHTLLLQEWIEQHPDSNLIAPTCYLVQIPGAASDVNDQNYLLIEEAIEETTSEQDKLITLLHTLPELRQAGNYVGLWSIHLSQFVVTPEGKVAVVDLEQPGNTPSDYFFHKNREKYERNCNVGQGEFDSFEKELKEKAVQEATKILCAISRCTMMEKR